jgi:hypothetical protein
LLSPRERPSIWPDAPDGLWAEDAPPKEDRGSGCWEEDAGDIFLKRQAVRHGFVRRGRSTRQEDAIDALEYQSDRHAVVQESFRAPKAGPSREDPGDLWAGEQVSVVAVSAPYTSPQRLSPVAAASDLWPGAAAAFFSGEDPIWPARSPGAESSRRVVTPGRAFPGLELRMSSADMSISRSSPQLAPEFSAAETFPPFPALAPTVSDMSVDSLTLTPRDTSSSLWDSPALGAAPLAVSKRPLAGRLGAA